MIINELIKKATLENNGAAKEAYRAIKTELLLNSSSKNPRPEGKQISEGLNELEFFIIKKLIKQREESISVFDANSRKDLADIEREQLKYLKEFLPQEISRDKIQEAVVTAYPNGFTQKEMGKIIKEIKTIYPTADGKLISEVVKEYIV